MADKYNNHTTRTITVTAKILKKSRQNDLQCGYVYPYDITLNDVHLAYRASFIKPIKNDGYRLLFNYEGKDYLIIYNK